MTRLLVSLMLCAALAACSSPEERVAGYIAQAQALFDDGDYEKSQLEVRNALQIRPKNAEARLLLARLSLENEKYREAIENLTIASESDPALLDAPLLLGEIYFIAQMADEVEQYADAAEQIAPGNAEALLLRARALLMRGDLDGAMAKTDEAIAANPDLLTASIFKASLYLRQGDPDAGIAHLDPIIARTPLEDSEKPRSFRLVLLDYSDRDDEAEAELRALMQDFPEQEDYIRQLAQRYIRSGRVDDAEQVLRDLAQRDLDNSNRRLDLVDFLAAQRSPDAAEAAIQAFLEDEPQSPSLNLAMAQLLDSQDRLADAKAAYEVVVQVAPASEEAYVARNRIASVLLRQDQGQQARAELESILADQPDNFDALVGRAAFNLADGAYDEVITDARIALRKNELSPTALLLLARGHAGKGETLLAREAYQRLLAIQPGHPAATNELALSFLAEGDAEQADAIWSEYLPSSDRDMESRIGLVRARIARGNLAGAESEARALIALDETDPRGYLELAAVQRAGGDLSAAALSYQAALDQAPDSVPALQGLTTALISDERADEAIALLNKQLQAKPDQQAARLLLADALAASGDRAAAEAVLESLIAEESLGARPFFALAALYPPASDQRIEALARAAEALPDNPEAAFFLAQALERSGQSESALQAYARAYALDSDNEILSNNYASLLLDAADDAASHAKALEITRKFSGSRNPAILDTLGWAYYRNGDYASAARYLEQAVSIAGQIPVLRYHLGMAYLGMGDPVRAEQELSRAVADAQADFPGLAEARARLAALEAGG